MGPGGISIWQLLIILAIVLIFFGGKRLRGLGSDLGETIKGFRKAMNTDENGNEAAPAAKPAQNEAAANQPQTIDVQAQKVQQSTDEPVRKD